MRIAFYAPMKPPDHPVPSGDRRMGRQLMQALRQTGHEVRLASRLRSWEGRGDPRRQARIRGDAARVADRLIAKWRGAKRRPQLWFSYRVYHKAPDWLGPAVADALDIPYVVAEASYAAKRANGPWADGLAASVRALRRADAVIAISEIDHKGLAQIVDRRRLHRIRPFVDTGPLRVAMAERAKHRSWWWGDAPGPWLLAVAMMRPGDKQRSYVTLADALRRLGDIDWRLAVVGDGPARDDCLAGLERSRLTYLGQRDSVALAQIFAAADIFVWPAVNEAYGLAILEAQAAGLPVVAGRSGGVPDVVTDRVTGLLTEPEDAASLAGAVRALISDPARRQSMGEAAAAHAATELDLAQAANALSRLLDQVAR